MVGCRGRHRSCGKKGCVSVRESVILLVFLSVLEILPQLLPSQQVAPQLQKPNTRPLPLPELTTAQSTSVWNANVSRAEAAASPHGLLLTSASEPRLRNHKLREKEPAAQSKNYHSEALQQRRSDGNLEDVPPRAQHCPVGLGNFASASAMTSAGWQLNVEDKFFGSAFVGWKGMMNVGSLKTTFTASGIAILIFGNDHEEKSPANRVKVELNGQLLDQAGPQEEHFLCFQFKVGDKLSVSEVYGKIRLKSLMLDCSPSGITDTSHASSLPYAANLGCDGDRQVWTASPSSGCSLKPDTYHGLVELALSKTHFLVQVYGVVPNEGVRKVVSAPQLTVVPSPGSIVRAEFSHCAAPNRSAAVGVVVLADAQHAESYKEQIQSLYCYAARRGYDMWHLRVRSFSACARFEKQFFFQKHCVVAEFLAQRAPGYTAAVVDGDVVAAVMERGLEQWMSTKADVQLYERAAGTEIAAGNYIVRNTPWTRSFLMGWAERVSRIPRGYSSADNGALHLHVVETLQLDGSGTCARMYAKLEAPVTNLGPYFEFVKCTKRLLGPPRRWRVNGDASLVIWPKFHFFVVDGSYLNHRGSSTGGPVFHHGYKARAWEHTAVHRTYYTDLPHCKLDSSRLKDHEDLGRQALGLVSPEMKSCVLRFACTPLGPDDPPTRHRACGDCS